VATGDEGQPYRLLDADGTAVEPVSVFLRELLAAGRSVATGHPRGISGVADKLHRLRSTHAQCVRVPRR
jgi:hypothetical protein